MNSNQFNYFWKAYVFCFMLYTFNSVKGDLFFFNNTNAGNSLQKFDYGFPFQELFSKMRSD